MRVPQMHRGAICLVFCSLALALGQIAPPAAVLRNKVGMEVHIRRTGAGMSKLLVPDAKGEVADVILGLETEEEYKTTSFKSGALVGRMGGRISGAQFTLDGVTYQLGANSDHGRSTLHGGSGGFHHKEWTVEASSAMIEDGQLEDGSQWVRLAYRSPAGEQGFPGTVEATVTYTLTEENELLLDIRATSDAPTPVNIFSIPYFNLGGHSSGDVLDHELTISAEHYMPVDASANPTGDIAPVHGTALDFRAPLALGAAMAGPVQELTPGGDSALLGRSGAQARRLHMAGSDLQHGAGARPDGYSESFALHGLGPDAKQQLQGFMAIQQPAHAATLFHPASGRKLEVLTTAPCLAIYTANTMRAKFPGKAGVYYDKFAGIALQAANFPDAVNHDNFPSVVLRPGQEYRQLTVWRFSAE